jgi:MFS family permease
VQDSVNPVERQLDAYRPDNGGRLEAAGHLPPAAGEVITSTAWRTLGVLLLLSAVSFVDRQVIALMVTPIKQDLGVSDFQIGLLQGVAFGLFYAAFGLPLGWLVDRTARRNVIWGGVTVWSLATTASGLAGNFWHLFAARLGVGSGEASLSPAAYSLISDLFPRRRLAVAVSIFATGSSLGAALATAGGGMLMSHLTGISVTLPLVGVVHGWQLAFLILGVPGLLIAPLIFTIPEPIRRGQSAGAAVDNAAFGRFLLERRRFFACHFIGFGCVSMLGYALLAWLPTYLIRHFHWGVGAAGTTAALLLLVAIPGGLSNGYIVDRMFAKGRTDAHLTYYVYASLVMGACGVAAFFVSSVGLFLLLLGVVLLLSPFTGTASAAVLLTTPNSFRGRMSALHIFSFNLLGLGLGALTVAAFTDFVYHDDAKVGLSIASTYALIAPVAAGLLAFGRPAMRRLVAQSEA